jgi:hypothetical protein
MSGREGWGERRLREGWKAEEDRSVIPLEKGGRGYTYHYEFHVFGRHECYEEKLCHSVCTDCLLAWTLRCAFCFWHTQRTILELSWQLFPQHERTYLQCTAPPVRCMRCHVRLRCRRRRRRLQHVVRALEHGSERNQAVCIDNEQLRLCLSLHKATLSRWPSTWHGSAMMAQFSSRRCSYCITAANTNRSKPEQRSVEEHIGRLSSRINRQEPKCVSSDSPSSPAAATPNIPKSRFDERLHVPTAVLPAPRSKSQSLTARNRLHRKRTHLQQRQLRHQEAAYVARRRHIPCTHTSFHLSARHAIKSATSDLHGLISHRFRKQSIASICVCTRRRGWRFKGRKSDH